MKGFIDFLLYGSLAIAGYTTLRWLFGSNQWRVTSTDLEEMEERIMSKLSEYLEKQKVFNARQETAIDSLVTSVGGITEDVKALNDKIIELQNSPGGVTPEDAVLIDELQAQGDALTTKLETVSTVLSTLDSNTPPPLPPVTS